MYPECHFFNHGVSDSVRDANIIACLMLFDTCENMAPKQYWLASVLSIISTFNEESNALNVGCFTVSDLKAMAPLMIQN